jgi:hypothetical protein
MNITRVGAHLQYDHVISLRAPETRDVLQYSAGRCLIPGANRAALGEALKSEVYFDGGAPVAPLGLL